MKRFFVFILLFIGFYSFAFKLKINLKKGEKFVYRVKKEQAIVLGNDKTAYRNNTELNLTFLVNIVKCEKEEIEMSFILRSANLRIVSPLGANEFNTEGKNKEVKNPFLIMLMEMKSYPVYYTFDAENLKLKDVRGFGELEQRVIERLDIKDKKFKEQIIEILKKKSNEIKRDYGFNTDMFPYLNKELKLNQQIKVNQEFFQGDTRIKSEVVYTVDNITKDFVFFKIHSNLNIPEKETVFNGLKAVSSLKGQQSGNLTVYKSNGLPEFYSLRQRIDGVFSIMDTGERFPIHVDTVLIIRFNRVN